MALTASAKVSKNKNSSTLYLTIPAEMARDSQFPLYENEIVNLEIKPEDGTVVIAGTVASARRVRKELGSEGKSVTKGRRAKRKA